MFNGSCKEKKRKNSKHKMKPWAKALPTYGVLQCVTAVYNLINVKVQPQHVKKCAQVWYETVKLPSLGYLKKVPFTKLQIRFGSDSLGNLSQNSLGHALERFSLEGYKKHGGRKWEELDTTRKYVALKWDQTRDIKYWTMALTRCSLQPAIRKADTDQRRNWGLH